VSNARGRANHKLYLGRILLGAWQEALAREELPQKILSQAYLPAIKGHLVEAYGWFLLAISAPDDLPAYPPGSCADLPATAEGIAVPGELRELQQLESSGWLGQLLACGEQDFTANSAPVSLGGLLSTSQSDTPGPEQFDAWARQLEDLMDRMGDSLDEY